MKKNSRSATLLMTLSLIPISAFPGEGREGSKGGGGGDIVVCYDQPVFASGEPALPGMGRPRVLSTTLLDYFEGENELGYGIDQGPQGGDYLTRVKYVIQRTHRIDPVLAAEMNRRLVRFFSDAHLLPRAQIPEISDANYRLESLTEKCVVRQFAVQTRTDGAERVKYLIDRDFFETASAETRAGLVLHEILYAIAIERHRVRFSDSTRVMNYFLSSKARERAASRDLLTELRSFHFLSLVLYESGAKGVSIRYFWPTGAVDVVVSVGHGFPSLPFMGTTLTPEGGDELRLGWKAPAKFPHGFQIVGVKRKNGHGLPRGTYFDAHGNQITIETERCTRLGTFDFTSAFTLSGDDSCLARFDSRDGTRVSLRTAFNEFAGTSSSTFITSPGEHRIVIGENAWTFRGVFSFDWNVDGIARNAAFLCVQGNACAYLQGETWIPFGLINAQDLRK